MAIFFLHAPYNIAVGLGVVRYIEFILNALPMAAFFFTTGYLISLSIDRDASWKSFFIKRFFRLVPVLFVSQIICLFTIRTINVKDFIINTFMITDLFYIKKNAWEHALIFTSWSLWVEVKFYFIACLCCSIFRKNKRLACYSQIFIAVAVLCVLAFLKVPWFINGSFYNCFIVIFAVFAGMVVYLYGKRYISFSEFFVCFVFCLLFPSIFGQYFHIGFLLPQYAVSTFFVLVMFLFLKNRVRDNKYIKCMANMSYSFYLLHPMALVWASRYWNASTDNNWLVFWQTAGHRCVFAILTLCICFVIYNKIEKPAYDFGRRLAKKVDKKNKRLFPKSAIF